MAEKDAVPEEIWLEAARFADMDPADRTNCDFAGWMQADYRHTEAFHALSDMLAEPALNDALSERTFSPTPQIAPTQNGPSRREFWQWATAAAVGGLTLWSGHAAWNRLTKPQVFETALGENRMLKLADGSRLYLNGGTRVVLPGRIESRRLSLTRGEAYFAVSHDPAHPFHIRLTNGQVTVLGTEFNINCEAQDTEIDVYKGTVQITGNTGKSRVLTRGMRTVMQDGVLHAMPEFDPAAGSWRTGWIEAHTLNLRQVTNAFTRYSGVRIVIPDKALASREITGRLRLDHPLNQLRVLSNLYHFRISVANNTITLES